MTTHIHKRYLFPLFLLFAVVVAACAGAPAPTPVPPPTSTPAPASQPATGGEEVSVVRTFVIVPAESKASYIVDEEFFKGALAKLGIKAGRGDTIGSTNNIEGQLQLNLNDLSAPLGSNEFTVNLTGLKTDQPQRDGWIQNKGPQFSKFPTAKFVATGIEGAPDSYTEGEEVQFKLMGDLTIREVTQPVTFDVTATLEGDTLSGVATASLRMSDFGIEPPNFANTLTVQDDFQVEVEITAREQ